LFFQIRCTGDKSCSGKTETVVITDMNYYPVAQYHFDLSGTAFGAMAKPGLNEKLRHSGMLELQLAAPLLLPRAHTKQWRYKWFWRWTVSHSPTFFPYSLISEINC
jgi:hypothetical protein